MPLFHGKLSGKIIENEYQKPCQKYPQNSRLNIPEPVSYNRSACNTPENHVPWGLSRV